MGSKNTVDFTIPILIAEENIDGEIVLAYEGSGILFQHKGRHFILSVSHVFDRVNQQDGFHIPVATGMSNVNGRLHVDANFDVAVFEIEESHVLKFSNYSFLTESDLIHLHPDLPATYFLSGYPFDKISYVPKRSAINYTHLSGDIESHVEQSTKNQEQRHRSLYLKYPADWPSRGLPHPRGLSGSGVWNKTPQGTMLSGINEYFDGTDCIRAIRIHILVGILNCSFGFQIPDPGFTQFKFTPRSESGTNQH